MFLQSIEKRSIFKGNYKFIFNIILYKVTLYCFWSIMASPGQKRGTCGHIMALLTLMLNVHIVMRKALC